MELLSKLAVPPSSLPGYISLPTPLPHIIPGSTFTAGEDVFTVTDFVGEGGFARVFSARSELFCCTSMLSTGLFSWENGPPAERDAVLKVQMPANDWEWHCLTQVQERCSTLSHPLTGSGLDWTGGFMSAPRCYTYRDGSVLVTQYQVIQLLWAGRVRNGHSIMFKSRPFLKYYTDT